MTNTIATAGISLLAGIATVALAEAVNFDTDAVGALPAGWIAGVTGRGAHRWTVEADPTATSPPHVLKQSARGDFPWCVKRDVSMAGGIVWRWKDGDNYYVARANALENNVSLYYTQGGRRITIKYVDAPVAKDRWHVLRVEFVGSRIAVSLDGKSYIEQEDTHIAGAGAVGVWTKADSVTVFDDFSYGAVTK